MERTGTQLYPATRYWLIGSLLFFVIGLASFLQPLLLLAWAPLVLGPIHIFYDIKYLVMIPGWYQDSRWWLVCALPLVLSIYFGPAFAWLSLAGVTLFFATSWTKRIIGFLLAFLGLGLIKNNAFLWGYVAIYLHNFVTLFLWLKFKKELGRRGYLFLFGTLAFSALILSGVLDPWFGQSTLIMGQKSWDEAIPLVASRLRPEMASRLAVVYVFLQMIHYLVWLYLIPWAISPSFFGANVRKLKSDTWMLGLTFLITVALIIYGYSHVWDARLLYLKMGGFHVYLEVVMWLLFYFNGKGPRAFKLA